MEMVESVLAVTLERCEVERSREPIDLNTADPTSVGVIYGLSLPRSQDDFLHMGCAWLTNALRAAHVLDNFQSVTKVSLALDPSLLQRSDCTVFLASAVYDFHNEPSTAPELLYIRLDSGSASSNTLGSRIYEINIYRLLESRLPFTIPAYCFGDICQATGQFFLATACVPGVHIDLLDFFSGELLEPFNPMSLEHCRAVVRIGGEMSKAYSMGYLGDDEFLRKSFRNDSVESHSKEKASAERMGDKFVRAVAAFQKIILGKGKHVLPSDLTSPDAMKLFRYAAAASRKHQELFSWFLKIPGYVSFSFDEVRGAVATGLTKDVDLRFCDLTSLSNSSTGVKLWSWLSCLPYDVLSSGLDELLLTFTESAFGRQDHEAPIVPNCDNLINLDIGHKKLLRQSLSEFRRHFFVAGVASMSHLLDSDFLDLASNQPEEIVDALKACSGSRPTMSSNIEKRVVPLINLLTLFVRSGAKVVIQVAIEFSSTNMALGSPSSMLQSSTWLETTMLHQVMHETVVVRETPEEHSPVVCILPLCSPVLVLQKASDQADRHSNGATLVQILQPVPGWVCRSCIVSWPFVKESVDIDLSKPAICQPFDWGRQPSRAEQWHITFSRFVYFLLFHHCRISHVECKETSAGSCVLCSVWALGAINSMLDTGQAVHYDDGRTFSPWRSWRVVSGSFFKNKDNEAWVSHSYLVCDDDGSIADITADQFGCEYPQIWWPADPHRYSASAVEVKSKSEG